jgi:hypothetical protein
MDTGRAAASGLHGMDACNGVCGTIVLRQLNVGEQPATPSKQASSGSSFVNAMVGILAHTCVMVASIHLPTTTSLRQSAERAVSAGQPLIIMTTLAGCPWCDIVRQQYLVPMNKAKQLFAFELDVRDRNSRLQAFDGSFTTPSDQTRAWKARFAPTVMFFDAKGQEIAERLVGVAVPDFYGSYLESRLAEAKARLR